MWEYVVGSMGDEGGGQASLRSLQPLPARALAFSPCQPCLDVCGFVASSQDVTLVRDRSTVQSSLAGTQGIMPH